MIWPGGVQLSETYPDADGEKDGKGHSRGVEMDLTALDEQIGIVDFPQG